LSVQTKAKQKCKHVAKWPNLQGKFGYNGLDRIFLRLLDEKFLDGFEIKHGYLHSTLGKMLNDERRI
jgi:hypothetical protein